MWLSDKALGRHLYVLGGTGVGKSRALETWIMQLIRQGEGVGVIDPHGELFYNLVARIAVMRNHRLAERVVIVNPLDPTATVGFNPLELQAGEVVERDVPGFGQLEVSGFRCRVSGPNGTPSACQVVGHRS